MTRERATYHVQVWFSAWWLIGLTMLGVWFFLNGGDLGSAPPR